MPIYEYRCKSCKKVIEVIQRFNDPPLRKCQSCSGRLEKLISRTSFQLKGGGWYASGYAKSGGSSSSKSNSAESSSSGSKDKKTKSSSGSKSSSSKGD
jgi:putative FmdB family regulatory protein